MPISVNLKVLNEPNHANGGLTIIQTKPVLLKQIVQKYMSTKAKAFIRLHADQSLYCLHFCKVLFVWQGSSKSSNGVI